MEVVFNEINTDCENCEHRNNLSIVYVIDDEQKAVYLRDYRPECMSCSLIQDKIKQEAEDRGYHY